MRTCYIACCADNSYLFAFFDNLTDAYKNIIGMCIEGLSSVAVVDNTVIAEARIPVAVILGNDNLAALSGIERRSSCVAVRFNNIYAPMRRAVGISGIGCREASIALDGPHHIAVVFI